MLVCGSRDWEDETIVHIMLEGLLDFEAGMVAGIEPLDFTLIEGGARGADRAAERWARRHAVPGPVSHEQYLADWDLYGKAAGAIRNQQMLDMGNPGVVLAFKDGFDWSLRRGGTEDMVKRAKKAGVTTYVIGRA